MLNKSDRPSQPRWFAGCGSSAEEQREALPGDEIITGPTDQTTHAITIRRSPEEVWPWLVQMGYGRAGWYTPAWVDRLWRVRNPSSDRIHASLQELAVGDQILDGPPGTATFTVRAMETNRSLVLHSRRHPLTGQAPDTSRRDPGPYLDFAWVFKLSAVPGGTRLLLRTRNVTYPRRWRPLVSVVLRPADIAMSRWMLQGIRRRAESGSLRRQPVSRARQVTLDAATVTRPNAVWGLFECDVTEARRRIDHLAATTGTRTSFTAFLCHAIALAVQESPPANSVRDRRGRIVTFDEVDPLVMIETKIDDGPVALGRVICAANHKSVDAIHNEIRAAQADPVTAEFGGFLRLAPWVPSTIRRAAVRLIDQSPRTAKRLKGTISVSSVGMFADRGGWGIASLHHTVSVTVGGMEPRFVSPTMDVPHQVLSVTLSVDHDILDGAPATRLAKRIQYHVEAASGLPAEPPSLTVALAEAAIDES